MQWGKWHNSCPSGIRCPEKQTPIRCGGVDEGHAEGSVGALGTPQRDCCLLEKVDFKLWRWVHSRGGHSREHAWPVGPSRGYGGEQWGIKLGRKVKTKLWEVLKSSLRRVGRVELEINTDLGIWVLAYSECLLEHGKATMNL